MSEMKPPGAQGLHGHALRDFYRGAMTKNIVKGQDGGTRGVDSQDHNAENKERAASRSKGPASTGNAQKQTPTQERQARDAGTAPENVIAEMVAASQQTRVDSTVEEVESEPGQQRRKKPATQQAREELVDEERDSSDPPTVELAQQEPGDAAHHASIMASIAKLLADPTTERQAFGAMALTDAELMKKTLGSPVRVAKHLLVLSSRMVEQGRARPDVLEYLATTFLQLGRDFGKRSFKDFSVNIGIGTFYPLEVRERLLQLDEDFLPTLKCRFTSSRRMLSAKVKETIVLEYPEDMVITEFAVKGGTRKGYVLAPLKEKGKHGLRFFLPGEYRVLLMGHDGMGIERLEEIRVDVTGEAAVAPSSGPAAAAGKPTFARLKRAREGG